MTTKKRVQELEAEAAFEACAQTMGGWDKLRHWAAHNSSHCKETLLRFIPESFFKQSDRVTLEDLVVQSCRPITEYSDRDILSYIRYHRDKLSECLDEAQRRGLVQTDGSSPELVQRKPEEPCLPEVPKEDPPELELEALSLDIQEPEPKHRTIPGQPPWRRPVPREEIFTSTNGNQAITDWDPFKELD